MSKHNYLKKLEITNFRGLRDVSLDNLGLVNVLVGGNNVGKTTVLEAVFLLTGNGNRKTSSLYKTISVICQ